MTATVCTVILLSAYGVGPLDLFFQKHPTSAAQEIQKLQCSPRWQDRDKAATVLRHIDWRTNPEVVSALAGSLLRDPSAHVRQEAAQTLGWMAPNLPCAHQALSQASTCDQDLGTRIWAKWALRRLSRCSGPCVTCSHTVIGAQTVSPQPTAHNHAHAGEMVVSQPNIPAQNHTVALPLPSATENVALSPAPAQATVDSTPAAGAAPLESQPAAAATATPEEPVAPKLPAVTVPPPPVNPENPPAPKAELAPSAPKAVVASEAKPLELPEPALTPSATEKPPVNSVPDQPLFPPPTLNPPALPDAPGLAPATSPADPILSPALPPATPGSSSSTRNSLPDAPRSVTTASLSVPVSPASNDMLRIPPPPAAPALVAPQAPTAEPASFELPILPPAPRIGFESIEKPRLTVPAVPRTIRTSVKETAPVLESPKTP